MKDPGDNEQSGFIVKIVLFHVIANENKYSLVHEADAHESVVWVKDEDQLRNTLASVVETMVIPLIIIPTIGITTRESPIPVIIIY